MKVVKNMNILNSASFNRLEGAVQAAEFRQRVISNNIANVDTPKFKRSEVLFEELLEQSMGSGERKLEGNRTNSRHIAIGVTKTAVPQAVLTTDETTSMNNSENNVDVDREMALLAKNQLSYNYYVSQINHHITMMRTGIGGGV